MRSEKRITARMMCSIMITATPRPLRREQDVRMSSTSALESPAIASSATSSAGLAASARASSSFRRSTWVRSAELSLGAVLRSRRAPGSPAPRPGRRGRGRARGARTRAGSAGSRAPTCCGTGAGSGSCARCQAHAPVGRQPRHVLALEDHGAAVARQGAGDAVDHGGLAGAVRADQAEALALAEVQADRVERDEAAEALGQSPSTSRMRSAMAAPPRASGPGSGRRCPAARP